MTLSVSLSPQVEALLRKRAEETGEAPEVYASKVLTEAITAPTIDEILAPVRREAAASGLSEEQLMDFGRELLEKVRAER